MRVHTHNKKLAQARLEVAPAPGKVEKAELEPG
jgi:hypothetical protein